MFLVLTKHKNTSSKFCMQVKITPMVFFSEIGFRHIYSLLIAKYMHWHFQRSVANYFNSSMRSSSSNGMFEVHCFSCFEPSKNNMFTSGSDVPESVEQRSINYFRSLTYIYFKLLLKSTKSIAFFESLSSMSRAPLATSNLTIS